MTNFLRGAMVLTVAGIVVKILGGLNRIFLSRLLGGEGIGLYQMAYPVYILLLSIVGAGIPIAVSIMIAEQAARGHYSGVRRIFHVTLAFMTVVAVLCGLALPFGAQAMIELGIVRDSRALPALAVLGPALSLSVIVCCFRGYFQGLQLMTPTALSQMADQFVRVCTMLALAWVFLPRGLEWAAAGASFGAVPGAAAGLILIAFLYYRHQRNPLPDDDGVFVIQSARHIIRRLVVLAVPVAAANMLLPAVASIDLFIVPLRLEAAGYSTHQATALYGYLTGMANGLVQLPAILTISLATSLVPAVSAAFPRGEGTSSCPGPIRLCALPTSLPFRPAWVWPSWPCLFHVSCMPRRLQGRLSASCPCRYSSSASSRLPAACCRAWGGRRCRSIIWRLRLSSRFLELASDGHSLAR